MATQTILLAPGQLTLNGGPIDVFLSSEDRPAGITAKVYRGSNFTTPVLTLTGDRLRNGQIRLSDAGSGDLTIPNSHPDRDLLLCDDVVRYELDGVPFHQWVVTEQKSSTARTSGGDQETVSSGPGILGLWAETVVFPSLGVGRQPVERDRVWSWISPSPIFDDSSWTPANSITTVGAARTTWPVLPFGDNFPTGADAADVIGPSTGTITNAPAGTWYCRQDFTIATEGQYGLWVLMDNIGTLYVDGVEAIGISESDQWADATFAQVTLSAGPHTIAADIFNDAPLGGGPTGLAWCLYRLNPAGEPVSSSPDVVSNASTAVLVEYPSGPPGMTVGSVLIGLLEEWQAMGMMTGWAVTFSETVDSNGRAWPTQEIATKVGTDGRTFLLDELAQTYIDVRAHAGGLVLDATIIDELGTSRALELEGPTGRDPATANITELTHERAAPRGTAALVLSAKGWSYIDQTVSGRRKAVLLGLGAQPSDAAAAQVARRELSRFGAVEEAITAGFRPRSDIERPDRSASVGDTISVPGWDSTPSTERVLSWTFREDEHGTIEWAPELKSVKSTQAERQERALKKMADGTVRGRSRVATPVNQTLTVTSLGSRCCTPTVTTSEVASRVGFNPSDGYAGAGEAYQYSYTADVACNIVGVGFGGAGSSALTPCYALVEIDTVDVASHVNDSSASFTGVKSFTGIPVGIGDVVRLTAWTLDETGATTFGAFFFETDAVFLSFPATTPTPDAGGYNLVTYDVASPAPVLP